MDGLRHRRRARRVRARISHLRRRDDGRDPPSLEVRLGAPEQRAHNFIVPVTVTNHGDETAEGITIEVSMEQAGGQEPAVRGELTIAFLPRRATREGFVTFDQDPRAAQLKARVLGYEKP